MLTGLARAYKLIRRGYFLALIFFTGCTICNIKTINATLTETTYMALPTASCSDCGSISVTVVTEEGTPLIGATAFLVGGRSKGQSAATDYNGSLSFRDLRASKEYGLVVSDPEFQTAAVTNVEVVAGKALVTKIVLKPSPEAEQLR